MVWSPEVVVRSRAAPHNSCATCSRHACGSFDVEAAVLSFDGGIDGGLPTLKGHSRRVNSVVFFHDSARLASVSDDNTVKLWDASSGECLQTLEGGHSGWVASVAFSHDSAWLASASFDNTVKIWDASSGECLQTLAVGKALFIVSFDTTSSYLHTEIGAVIVNATLVSNMALVVMDPQNPRHQGVALSLDGTWITYTSENLLWLPSEYLPAHSAVLGKTLSIGARSRKVLICNVNLNES